MGNRTVNQVKPSILIVDDEPDILALLDLHFKKQGWKVLLAEHLVAALEVLSRQNVHIILSDIWMPNGSGLDLLKMVKAGAITPTPPPSVAPKVFLMTGLADITPDELRQLGADGIIAKPFQPAQVVVQVRKSLKL